MSLRAYYRDPTAGDLSLPLDSGRPVSEGKLRTLGMKWWSVEGSPDERMRTFKELSKSLGFEDGHYEHVFDLGKQTGSPYDPAMASKDLLESWGQDNLFLAPTFILYLCGNVYIDFKEPGTDSFIRLVIPPKYAISYPGGALWQASSCKDTPHDFAVHILFRAMDHASVQLIGEGLDKHPARMEYVQSVLGDAVNLA
ncbi:1,2-dihydroxy-3-keto-5-methylthiopentene dioxygenase [Marasmius tenuissimus]|uniref:1,2-dihydroxy-3-keto-5-methylthiopentene dioxygenase n=1 Tax=Marasmius tenuissimus TaxID=585030 RepID=A0ABR2ZME7_9AGAR